MKLSAISLFFCASLVANANTFEGPDPVLNTKTYLSESGRCELKVEPTDPFGCGPSHCRLKIGGKQSWAATLPFTFYDAVVGDDGIAAGYAYNSGRDGMEAKTAKEWFWRALIIDARGHVVPNEKNPRRMSSVPDAGIEPIIGGLLLQTAEDRFIVQVEPAWKVYQLSTGKHLPDIVLEPATPEGFFVRAATIRDTPLILVQRITQNQEQKRCGALFSLIDQRGETVWQLALPDDYDDGDDPKAALTVRWKIIENGAILETSEPARFALWLVKDAKRATFTVAKTDTRWKVEAAAHEPYVPPADPTPTMPKIVQRPLETLGSFILQDGPPTGVAHDIDLFGFNGAGEIGFIRKDEPGWNFVLLSAAGEAVAQVPLRDKKPSFLAWLSENRWGLIVQSEHPEEPPQFWILDSSAKALNHLKNFAGDYVQSFAGTGDGGFVVSWSRGEPIDAFSETSSAELAGFDRDGHELWRTSHSGNFYSLNDLTLTSRGEIAGRDSLDESVKFFSPSGKFLRALKLTKSADDCPGFEHLTALADGSILVADEKARFVQFNADGNTRRTFQPKYPDGTPIKLIAGCHAAPDGRVWISDGSALYRLTGDGHVTQTIGEAPNRKKLGPIASVTADSRGRIYAQDRRTSTVHVFDSRGQKLRVSKMSDLDATLRQTLVQELGSHKTYLIADTGNALVLGYREAFLTDKKGRHIQKIMRRADGKWLDNMEGAAVAPEGSFVILSDTLGKSYEAENVAITLYSANAKPLVTAPVPFSLADLIGFNGRQLVLAQENKSIILDKSGAPVQEFAVTEPGVTSQQMLTRNGRELWVFEYPTRKVTRYAMPK